MKTGKTTLLCLTHGTWSAGAEDWQAGGRVVVMYLFRPSNDTCRTVLGIVRSRPFFLAFRFGSKGKGEYLFFLFLLFQLKNHDRFCSLGRHSSNLEIFFLLANPHSLAVCQHVAAILLTRGIVQLFKVYAHH